MSCFLLVHSDLAFVEIRQETTIASKTMDLLSCIFDDLINAPPFLNTRRSRWMEWTYLDDDDCGKVLVADFIRG